MAASIPTASEANLLSWEEVTVPMVAPQGQKLVSISVSCQYLCTGPQMVLANVVQEVSAGAGIAGFRSRVNQVLSVDCTRIGTELATGAVAPMDLSSKGMIIPDDTNGTTNLREFLPKAAVVDCFTLLLAQHLADVSYCYIGPSMPSGICMEIHTEIVQKRKKKPSRDKGIPRQPHVYL